MSIQGPLLDSRFVRHIALSLWDGVLLVLVLLAAITFLPMGADMVHAVRGHWAQGIVETFMFGSVSLVVALLPARMAYNGLYPWLTPTKAATVAILIGACIWGATDRWLSQTPVPPDLSAVFVADSTPAPVTPPADGVLGLAMTHAGQSIFAARPDAIGCGETCLWLLHAEIAQEVALVDLQTMTTLARYRRGDDPVCTPPDTHHIARSLLSTLPAPMTLCTIPNPDPTPPRLSYEAEWIIKDVAAFHWPDGLAQVLAITVRDGAVSQRLHVARIADRTGGGLLSAHLEQFDRQVTFLSRPTRRTTAAFDLSERGPFPESLNNALMPADMFAVIFQTLGTPLN